MVNLCFPAITHDVMPIYENKTRIDSVDWLDSRLDTIRSDLRDPVTSDISRVWYII